MPTLSVFVDLHSINLLLYKSSTEFWFDVIPYVYSSSLFSASFSSDEFYLSLLQNFCELHLTRIEDCDVLVTGFLEAPVLVNPNDPVFTSKLHVKMSKSLHEVITNITGIYPIVVNNHSVLSRDFCYSSTQVRPLKKVAEHLDLDEENFYANLELYPQVVSNEVAVQIDLDTNLSDLLSKELDRSQDKATQIKSNKKNKELVQISVIPQDIPVVFGGSRFSQKTSFKELDYLLMLSFFQTAGIYELKKDEQNKYILAALLKIYDPSLDLSTDALNVPNEATVINSKSAIECVITTDQGTSQLLQLEKNRLLVVPSSSENRVHLNIKSKDLGSQERVVEGSNVGLIFDTRESKGINLQDIKIFSMSLRNLRIVNQQSISSLT